VKTEGKKKIDSEIENAGKTTAYYYYVLCIIWLLFGFQ